MATKRRRCADEPKVLPDHLIEEILLRLPHKSLLRCRCLSRAWAAKLSWGDFVDYYRRATNLRGGPRIFGVEDAIGVHEPSKVAAPLTSAPRVIPIASFPRIAMGNQEEEPPIHPIEAGLATSQCRGLVLVKAYPIGEASQPDMYFVCNPTTGQMTALPEGRTRGLPGYREQYESLGLGYDVRTKRHKVVRIYYHGHSSGCEVLEINGPTGTWRRTGETPTGGWIYYCFSVFAQGHVYWLASRELYPRRGRQEMFVMTFSLGDEKLGTIQPPPLDDMTHHDLTELGGRLCLFASCKCSYDIWLLDHYGSGGATWDLRYRIEVPVPKAMMPDGVCPLAVIDDGRRILLAEPCCPDQIYAYDPLTRETEKLLQMSIPNSHLGIGHAAVYEESIACPGRQPRKDTIFISSPSTQALWLVLQLQLLPQHTIGRLMCVCRSWRSVICCQYAPRHY